MIQYKNGTWGIMNLFQLTGSVVPKALMFACPAAALAILLHQAMRGDFIPAMGYEANSDLGGGIPMGVSGFYSVMGFLLVFRTQQAYSRWWEGGTLLQTVRGEWFNAYSQLLAFSNRDEA